MVADPRISNTGVNLADSSRPPDLTLLAAGVDYIAASAATPAKAELLGAVGWKLAYSQAEAGDDLRPWNWKGYSGISCGPIQCGARADGVFVRCSGGLSAETWQEIARHAEHVSRLDLAVTIRSTGERDWATETYSVCKPEAGREGGRTIQKGRLIQTWVDGNTCYLGARTSPRFARIYDKGKESNEAEYRDCWRWEVEYKGRLATPLATRLRGVRTQSVAICAYVWTDFERMGAAPPWGVGAEVDKLSIGRRRTDDLRRLEWLRTQVSPTIRTLREHGRIGDVYQALGLDLLS